MIGTTVRSSLSFPVATLLCLVAALLLLVGAVVVRNLHPALVAGPFLVLALFCFLAQPRRVVLHFTEEGIEVARPVAEFIAYDAIETLRPFGRSHNFRAEGKERFAFNVVHSGGVLHVPARLNVSSEAVLQFLDSQLPRRNDPDLPSSLRQHAERETERFGKRKVTAYSARAHLGYRTGFRNGVAYLGFVLACGVLLLSGGILSAQPNSRPDDAAGYIAAGLLVGIFGSLGWLVIRLLVGHGGVRGIRQWQRSGLVISPSGLALEQGDLTGELEWEEIRDVKLDARQRFGILVRIEGANILIADLYRAPLSHLLEAIRDNWREDRGD